MTPRVKDSERKQVHRVFIECSEHGRVVARVYIRRNRIRANGTVAEDRVKVCPYCARLNHKAWYLFGGRERSIARARTWNRVHWDRVLERQRERRANALVTA
jgi:hypothetical protein